MTFFRWKILPIILLITANIFVGCGGGSGSATTPATPQFTSTPAIAAEEGAAYTYQVTATASDMSAITYELSSGPMGATLAGNTVTWTPTHQESRVGNAFTVKATTAAGGSATQTWNVTPNGTVNITAVITYWGPTGSTEVAPQWLANLPYPAALVPQSDGSLQRLQGAANADGTFGIPNVPAGHYWLQINPNANYWTSASDFDDGFDVIGQQGSRTTQNTTTFDYMIGESAPISGLSLITARTNIENLDLLNYAGGATFSQLDFQNSVTSPDDWSKVTTIYMSSYEASSGSFSGFSLYSEQTLSNVTIVDGSTNSITATLTPSPTASILLSIQGTAWSSAAQGVGPGTPSVSLSDYAVYAQPYLTDGIAIGHNISFIGPDLTLLRPTTPLTPSPLPPVIPGPFNCVSTTGPTLFAPGFPYLPPITTDIDYGMVSYGDPYPSQWPRVFQYCEVSTVSLPRPNSTAVDLFQAINKQTTALPTGSVAPLLTTVQSPTINGSSLFGGTTLNTTTVTVSWNAPSVGQPFGYYVSVYELTNSNVSSTVIYAPAGRYGTRQTSVDVPFLSAGTYVFTITAVMDGGADMEKSPLRTNLPSAETGVVSAPIVIAPGATAMVKR